MQINAWLNNCAWVAAKDPRREKIAPAATILRSFDVVAGMHTAYVKTKWARLMCTGIWTREQRLASPLHALGSSET